MEHVWNEVVEVLTDKVTKNRKASKILLGVVTFLLLVFGIYQLGYNLGEFLYYIQH